MDGSRQALPVTVVASGDGKATASLGVRVAAAALVGFGGATVSAALVEFFGPVAWMRNLSVAYEWLAFIFELDQRSWALFGLGALLVLLGVLTWRGSLPALVIACIVVLVEVAVAAFMVYLLSLFTGTWDGPATWYLLARLAILCLLAWGVAARLQLARASTAQRPGR